MTEKAIGIITDIGITAAKERFGIKRLRAEAKEILSNYLDRHEKQNFDCSLEEEIDFEGLAEYIRNDLMEDVKTRLFGERLEREAARKTIADKAAYYAQAKTKLSQKRARHLAVTAVEMLKHFFRSKIDWKTLFVATEIEDTIIAEMSKQHKAQERQIDALAKQVQNDNIFSIGKNISLANNGQLDDVEKNVATFFARLGKTHILTPYYGFTMDGVSCLKSVPLRPDAVELYPPRLEITATEFKIGNKPLPNVDADTFNRAYRTQSPIEFDVTAAQKYLGHTLDPVQHEAEKLTGSHIVLNPPAFPPAFPCSILLDGETAVDYLLLRTERIEEDETIIITNDEQKDCSFRVILSLNTATKSFSWAIKENQSSNTDALLCRRFLKRAISAKRVELKSLNENKVFISSKAYLASHDSKKLDAEIEFLDRIVAIERQFHIALAIPKEIEPGDYQVVNRIYSMIQNGKYCGICANLVFSSALTEELRQSIYAIGEEVYTFSCDLGVRAELFGQELNFRIIRTFYSVRLDGFEKVKEKLKVLDNGDQLKLPFVSSDMNPEIHYSDMFYSEERANKFLK